MQVLNIFHVLIAIALIGFVLIQRGQGATAGAAFGSGASGTVFGARGAGNFLSRSTWVLAALFCAISLTMAVLVSRMMQPTAPDLGVVVATEPAAQVQEEVPASELSTGPGEPSAADLPAFERATDQQAPDQQAADQQAEEQAPEAAAEAEGDDLPAPGAESAAPSAEDLPPADDS